MGVRPQRTAAVQASPSQRLRRRRDDRERPDALSPLRPHRRQRGLAQEGADVELAPDLPRWLSRLGSRRTSEQSPSAVREADDRQQGRQVVGRHHARVGRSRRWAVLRPRLERKRNAVRRRRRDVHERLLVSEGRRSRSVHGEVRRRDSMTADVISLSELSDEPIEQPAGLGYAFSDRLEAVWDRLPKTRQGQKARIRTWLARAGIDSVAKLGATDRY